MHRIIAFLFLPLWLISLSLQAAPAQTDWASTDTVHSQLTASHAAITPGQVFQVAWDIRLDDDWHVYWKNPGDSGLAPLLTPDNGFTVTATAWPTPGIIRIPPITNYGYHNRVVIMHTLKAPANLKTGPLNLPVKLEYLFCKDVCMPGRINTVLALNVADTSAPNPAFDVLASAHAATLPQPLSVYPSVTPTDDGFVLNIDTLTLEARTLHFIPDVEGWMDDSADQEGPYSLTIHRDPHSTMEPPTPITGLIVTDDGRGFVYRSDATVPSAGLNNTPPPAAGRSSTQGESSSLPFLTAVGFALLAGLILNLMPCVLPVLALKIFSLVKQPASHRIPHALAYMTGVVGTFVALGLAIFTLQQTGAQLGWGFHLQNPWFVGGLIGVMMALGLSFMGVWTLGERLTRFGSTDNTNAIGTGVLAVIVATPCTVPFMGGAMAYALTAPLMANMAVFGALGVGMALPFVLIGGIPALAGLLPKPGRWMETFKKWLALPMFATAVWLAWVLAVQTGWMQSAATRDTVWQPWSPEAVETARRTGPVFVDFTADWCITCKVTEATVLNRDDVQALFRQYGVILLKADWTKQDPVIAAELERHGRRGVPLYLVYRTGKNEPRLLPQLLTYGLLKDALTQ